MAYRLVDVDALHRRGEIPAPVAYHTRAGLQPGERALVAVQTADGWTVDKVRVLERIGGRYLGTPARPGIFGGATRVWFSPAHVVGPVEGVSSRVLAGAGLIVLGLVGLWWERKQQTAHAPNGAAPTNPPPAQLQDGAMQGNGTVGPSLEALQQLLGNPATPQKAA